MSELTPEPDLIGGKDLFIIIIITAKILELM
jgi:hypothetical protein